MTLRRDGPPPRDTRAASDDRRLGADQRQCRDANGVDWSVFERRIRHVTYLFFESDGAFRRVALYPSDWRGRSDDALLALSWSR